jgi:ssDNA-specific exonuclease RecJ
VTKTQCYYALTVEGRGTGKAVVWLQANSESFSKVHPREVRTEKDKYSRTRYAAIYVHIKGAVNSSVSNMPFREIFQKLFSRICIVGYYQNCRVNRHVILCK